MLKLRIYSLQKRPKSTEVNKKGDQEGKKNAWTPDVSVGHKFCLPLVHTPLFSFSRFDSSTTVYVNTGRRLNNKGETWREKERKRVQRECLAMCMPAYILTAIHASQEIQTEKIKSSIYETCILAGWRTRNYPRIHLHVRDNSKLLKTRKKNICIGSLYITRTSSVGELAVAMESSSTFHLLLNSPGRTTASYSSLFVVKEYESKTS